MKTRLLLCVSTVTFACSGAPAKIQTETVAPSPATAHEIVVIPRVPSLNPTEAIEEAKSYAQTAVSQPALPIWWGNLPEDVSVDAILAGTTPVGSRSSGSVGDGTLVNSVQLEKNGTYHEIVDRFQKRGTNYGTKELVDVIKHGAFVVGTELGGAKLRVGNLSVESGGDIRWSRSHNSGRDADLAFFVVNKEGESVPLPTFTGFDENGSSAAYPELQFDVARNWKLVEALVSHDVGVQWIFVSIPLKEKLLRHARENDVDSEIIARAESVLHQPTDALPHDDHFHLRIACSGVDRIEGCLPSGPAWSWLPDTAPLMLSRTKTMLDAALRGERGEEALEFLKKIRSPYRADVALWIVASGERPELHDAAIQIARGPFQWSPFALSMVQRLVNDPASKYLDDALFIARRALDFETWSVVLAMASDREVPPATRAKYVDALLLHTDEAVLAPLVGLLDEGGPVSESALRVLQHLTNHSGPSSSRGNREKVVAYWNSFATQRGLDREVWLRDGFVAQGVKNADDLDALVNHITAGPDFGAYNANRRLREITGRWSPLEFKNAARIQARWKKWIDRNRERLIAGAEVGVVVDGFCYQPELHSDSVRVTPSISADVSELDALADAR